MWEPDKVELLKRAAEDPEMLSAITPVVAASLGVMPVGRTEASARFACRKDCNPDCLKLLERHVGSRVEPVFVNDRLLRTFVQKAYLREANVNYNTFEVADFVLREECEGKLLNEKQDLIPEPGSALGTDRIVFVDISYHSMLRNLDDPDESEAFSCGSADIPFRIQNGQPVVAGDTVSDDTIIFLRQDFFYDGCQNIHGIVESRITSLPHMIHPTEMQIARVAEDGRLTFYIYDHFEYVSPGEQAQWPVEYYFLSFGHRYHRELLLDVKEVFCCDKSQIGYVDHETEWNLDDLDRWFRLDDEV